MLNPSKVFDAVFFRRSMPGGGGGGGGGTLIVGALLDLRGKFMIGVPVPSRVGVAAGERTLDGVMGNPRLIAPLRLGNSNPFGECIALGRSNPADSVVLRRSKMDGDNGGGNIVIVGTVRDRYVKPPLGRSLSRYLVTIGERRPLCV